MNYLTGMLKKHDILTNKSDDVENFVDDFKLINQYMFITKDVCKTDIFL